MHKKIHLESYSLKSGVLFTSIELMTQQCDWSYFIVQACWRVQLVVTIRIQKHKNKVAGRASRRKCYMSKEIVYAYTYCKVNHLQEYVGYFIVISTKRGGGGRFKSHILHLVIYMYVQMSHYLK